MFSKKATTFDEIFTADLMLCSKCQIDGEDFFNFCGLLRKHELYISSTKYLSKLNEKSNLDAVTSRSLFPKSQELTSLSWH